MSDEIKTYAVINDLQIPYEDKQVVYGLVVPFIRELRPYGIILNGDIVDCYSISDFDKSKNADLEEEIEGAEKLMKALPDAKVKEWIGGNHEDRARRVAWRNLPMKGLIKSFPEAFHIEDNGYGWREYGDHYNLGKLIVTHGFMVSADSGSSAKRHFTRLGNSVMIGHTHRLGVFYKTNWRGMHGAWENGCLCQLHAEYVQNPDWQQGFSIVQVFPDGFFHVQQIPIIDRHLFFYGSERFEVGRRDRRRVAK